MGTIFSIDQAAEDLWRNRGHNDDTPEGAARYAALHSALKAHAESWVRIVEKMEGISPAIVERARAYARTFEED